MISLITRWILYYSSIWYIGQITLQMLRLNFENGEAPKNALQKLQNPSHTETSKFIHNEIYK